MPSTIHYCPLVDWYNYAGQCKIATCKFNTQVLKTGCISLERKDTHGKKQLTDRELRYYKFNNSINVNEVTQYRKRVLIQSKKLLALYYYTQYVLNSCSMRQYTLPESCSELLLKFPFKIVKLGITPMLLANIFVLSNFEGFCTKTQLNSDYNIWDLFFMTQKRWHFLYEEFVQSNPNEFNVK